MLLLVAVAFYCEWKTQPRRLFHQIRGKYQNPVPKWVAFAENVPFVSRILDRFHPKTPNFRTLVGQLLNHPRRAELLGLILKNIRDDDGSLDLTLDFEVLDSILQPSPETLATLIKREVSIPSLARFYRTLPR
jgi:hypothetical protein